MSALGQVEAKRPPEMVEGARSLSAVDFSRIASGAQAYLREVKRENDAAIDRYGVGLVYGKGSAFAQLSASEKRTFVRSALARRSPELARNDELVTKLLARMGRLSCMSHAMSAVSAGYTAAGLQARWAQIARIVDQESHRGTTLARELAADGWEGVYWSADARGYRGVEPSEKQRLAVADQTLRFDPWYLGPDGTFQPGDGGRSKRSYYGVSPTHGLIGFQPASGPPNEAKLRALDGVPFFVGVAASGYHTIVGLGRMLRDAHLGRNPDDKSNLDCRPFNEIAYLYDTVRKAYVQGPSGSLLPSIQQSGLIMVPPGTFASSA